MKKIEKQFLELCKRQDIDYRAIDRREYFGEVEAFLVFYKRELQDIIRNNLEKIPKTITLLDNLVKRAKKELKFDTDFVAETLVKRASPIVSDSDVKWLLILHGIKKVK